ncbi:MAG: amidohydrolase family protein [Phycisphaeraceae bacterium]|nr:amidohydrolase family protein [Phycisphaeraceae bacterium]MCW5761740.1 amidohydrolase family protein [Phycisphaeraceae bacterium]
MNRPDCLREAHAHLFQHGRALGMVDLAMCASSGEVLDRVRERASWGENVILGHGARPESWNDPRWPTRDELEAASGDIPCCLWCFDYHALMANRAALALAGIDGNTPSPAGGLIERDRSGRLTGVVYERAAQMVWEAMPEPESDARGAILRAAIHDLSQTHGFGEIHDLKTQEWLGPALAAMDREQTLAATCVLWPLVQDLRVVAETRGRWEGEHVRLGGGKIFVDGTLNSRTAWMLSPFKDGRVEHPCGLPMMSPAEIEEAVRACDATGVPMAAHAIGDAAVRAVLDAIEHVRPRTPGFRIEHCEVIDEADVSRFARLGVIASVQPCHLLYDTEVLERALPHRLDRVMPLRELIEAGCTPGVGLIFGSDTPIVRPHPQDSIDAATRRRRNERNEQQAIGLDQRLTEAEAWECFRGGI